MAIHETTALPVSDPPGGRDFATATAVAPRGEGRYAVHLDPSWSIAGALNGGYLLAVMARAALADVAADAGRHADSGAPALRPVAATATYLSLPASGEAQVEVGLLRAGRRTRQVRARLLQDDEARAEVHLVLGSTGGDGFSWNGVEPMALPPMEECFKMPVQPPGAPFSVDLMRVVDERLDPACTGFVAGSPSGAGELRGWLSLGVGLDVGLGAEAEQSIAGDLAAARLLFAVDALPPATFDLGLVGWVPTLSLSAHVRALPAPGPLRVRQRARLVDGGLVDEVCDVWDSAGRLVAHATQLAVVRA